MNVNNNKFKEFLDITKEFAMCMVIKEAMHKQKSRQIKLSSKKMEERFNYFYTNLINSTKTVEQLEKEFLR